MIAVVDVSSAVEIILQKDKHSLFDENIKESSWIIAPDLYISELSNVFWKYHKAKAITRDECIQYVEDGINLIDDYIEAKELWKEALGEGIKNNHSVYDMYYAILARRNDATLLTNDRLLANICKKLKISLCY